MSNILYFLSLSGPLSIFLSSVNIALRSLSIPGPFQPWRPATAQGPGVSIIASVLATVTSPSIVSRWAIISSPSSIITSISRYVRINICAAWPRWPTASRRTSVPILYVFVDGRPGWEATGAFSLPRRTTIFGPVPISTPVDPVAATAVSVTAVEARRGTVRVWTQSYSTTLRRWRKSGLAVVELSTIQLMTLFVEWYLVRLKRKGHHLEVWMLQSINRVDSCSPV